MEKVYLKVNEKGETENAFASIGMAICGIEQGLSARLVQNAMIIAGIGTLIQLFPLWRVGAKLPIVMGISFTFLSISIFIGTTYGYGAIPMLTDTSSLSS